MKLQDRRLSVLFYKELSKAKARKALKARIQFIDRVNHVLAGHFHKLHVMGGK